VLQKSFCETLRAHNKQENSNQICIPNDETNHPINIRKLNNAPFRSYIQNRTIQDNTGQVAHMNDMWGNHIILWITRSRRPSGRLTGDVLGVWGGGSPPSKRKQNGASRTEYNLRMMYWISDFKKGMAGVGGWGGGSKRPRPD
jgi:hypothetical protein